MVAGLGNPGRKYERNRHNIGFLVVDELIRRHPFGAFRGKFGGDVTTGLLAGQNVLLLKPMEYMNHSGYAVQRAASFHDVAPEQMVVIHDDIDLDFGRIRAKAGGGHGGHNGLRSIIQQLGSREFLRVRVGVGKPGAPAAEGRSAADRDRRVAGYVLSDFPQSQSHELGLVIDAAADAVEHILDHGIEASMNEFNGREAVFP